MKTQISISRSALNVVAGLSWYLPFSFEAARVLGSRYSLRCVLFHDVADDESAFTRGLRGTISRKDFEETLRFLTKHYTPVSMQQVLSSFDGQELPPRPLLVTFDDAYVSISDIAAPLCSKYGVPGLFFINAACIDNRQLALDNLVCYIANVFGLDTMNNAIHCVQGNSLLEVRSLKDIFSRFLPCVSLETRTSFRNILLQLTGINESDLAFEAGLYLTSQNLRDLAAFNFEIGDHTYTHVNCRTLSVADFSTEIDLNRIALETISGTKVRSFSVPYGSSRDLTGDLTEYLHRSGYEAVFLAEGRSNLHTTSSFQLNRISINTSGDGSLFSEIELLPRLRTLKDKVVDGVPSTLNKNIVQPL